MHDDLDLNPLTDFDLISICELNQLMERVTAETWIENLDAFTDQDEPIPRSRASKKKPS